MPLLWTLAAWSLLGCDARTQVLDPRDAPLDTTALIIDGGLDGGMRDAATSDGGALDGNVMADGGSPEETQALAEATRFCDHMRGCTPATFSTLFLGGREHCIRTRSASILNATRRGRRVVDPAACADALYSVCPDPAEPPEACQLIPGSLGEGARCDYDDECGLDGVGRRMRCAGDCGGVCLGPFDEGEPCAGNEDCDEGLVCTLVGTTGLHCVAYTTVADGEACGGLVGCGPGSACVGAGICARNPTAGEVCDSTSGLHCVGSYDVSCIPVGGGIERCLDRPVSLPAGSTCVAGDDCAGGVVCLGGVCPTSCLDAPSLCRVPDETCDPDTGRCEYQPLCP